MSTYYNITVIMIEFKNTN